MPTVMWEAQAAEGRIDELVGWAHEQADPAAALYRSADLRVVVIDPSGAGLPQAPAELVARPAHVWSFEPVPR